MTRPNAQVSLRASNEDECLGGLRVCVNSVAQSLVKKVSLLHNVLFHGICGFPRVDFLGIHLRYLAHTLFQEKKQTEAFICHLYQNELQRAHM